MNVWTGVGYIGRDIEVRTTTTDMQVARFSIGINRGKDRDGQDKGTDWINCVAFGRTAENIGKYFSKGSQIAVTGHIQTGKYDKDGVTHFTTDVIVDRFDFCGKKSEPTYEPQPQGFSTLNEDVPF